MQVVFMRLFFLTVLLLLASCQSLFLPVKKEVKPTFPLLSPASLGQSVVVTQLISGERDGHAYKIVFQVEVEPYRLAMVGSTTGGNTLFSVLYENNNTVSAELSPLLPDSLDPSFVLADFQLTYWPAEQIKQALMGSDFSLHLLNKERQLYKKDKLVTTVSYSHANPWQGVAIVHNVRWNYRYKIEILVLENIALENVALERLDSDKAISQ